MSTSYDPADFGAARISPHALGEMARRRLPEEQIRNVLRAPEQVLAVRPGRVVVQALDTAPTGRRYVVRVFVDVDEDPPVVVTAYRSSKISKYWREQ